LKLREECQEQCDAIIETEETREISDEMLKEIEEGKYEEIPKPNEKEIKNRPREHTFGTKEETFLWAYETIFNWLGINFDGHHKKQLWKAIQYDVANSQENLYEIRLRQIIEFEICGEKFKWWNEASRRARKKRTKNFQSRLFQDRNDKMLCG
jgi:hypothetical protein